MGDVEPRRRVALLLIHGMGEQEPHELTDTFAVNLTDAYSEPGKSVTLAHHIVAVEGHAAPESYIELSVRPDDGEEGGGPKPPSAIDIHEVYWADKPQGLIKLKEVGSWLFATALAPLKRWSQHASAFYRPDANDEGEFEPVKKADWKIFLREILLALLLPLVGLVLLMFTLNAAGHVDSYVDGLRADLESLGLPWTDYVLLAVFVVSLVSAVFMTWGAWRISRRIRIEMNRRGVNLGKHGERWRFLRAWGGGTLVTAGVWFAVAWLSYTPTAVQALMSKILRLEDDEPFRRVLLIAAAGALGIAVWAWLITRVWRIRWGGSTSVIRVVMAVLVVLGPIVAAWAYYPDIPDDWRQALRIVAWLATVFAAWKLSSFLVSSLGDVAIYFGGLDNKSKYHGVREGILTSTTGRLAALLERKQGPEPEDLERCKDPREPYYQEVFVAAHSLGSVIAFDTINRIVTEQRTHPDGEEHKVCDADFERLRGFYSFGSPLDKVVYFFHKTAKEQQPVRAQILSSRVAFRRHSSGRPYGSYKFKRYEVPSPHPFRWYNAWSWGDVLGHRLDYYKIDKGKQFHFDYVPLVAHTQFWSDPEFYETVIEWIHLDGP